MNNRFVIIALSCIALSSAYAMERDAQQPCLTVVGGRHVIEYHVECSNKLNRYTYVAERVLDDGRRVREPNRDFGRLLSAREVHAVDGLVAAQTRK